jgi:hypothetical protein
MNSTTVDYKHVNVDNIELSKMMPNKERPSFSSAYVSYRTNKNGPSQFFRLQLKNKKVTIGLNYSDQYNSYSLLISLTDEELEKMGEIEEKIQELGYSACSEIHKKKKKKGELPHDYISKSSLKPADELKGYSASMGLKFKHNPEGKFYCSLIDKTKKELVFTTTNLDDYLTKNSTIDVILSCSLYSLNDFGITWKPVKIRLVEKGSRSVDAEFLDSDNEEEETAEFGESSTESEEDEYSEAVKSITQKR